MPCPSLQKTRLEDDLVDNVGEERVIDLSFMNRDKNVSKVLLHTSQISFAVKGVDRTRYRALMLVRTNSADDTVESYMESELQGQGAPNPFTAGEDLADTNPCEPRDFWLNGVSARMVNVVDEWKVVRVFCQDAVKGFKRV
jgi:hypothetical protein